MKHLNEEQLILYYYGEADDDPFVDEHLSSCEPCRAEYAELKRILSAVNDFAIPERSAAYASEVWDRLQPRLRRQPQFFPPAWLRPRRLAWAAALAAIVVAAFLTGRFWQRPATQTVEQHVQLTPEQIRERVLLASVADHLERSRMVLLDVSHTDAGREADISADRAWARELLAENRIYRQCALRAGQAGVASVLDDLERVLLEIANSPSRISAAELGGIRERIDSQGLIFKLEVITSSLRRKQNDAARELARRTS